MPSTLTVILYSLLALIAPIAVIWWLDGHVQIVIATVAVLYALLLVLRFGLGRPPRPEWSETAVVEPGLPRVLLSPSNGPYGSTVFLGAPEGLFILNLRGHLREEELRALLDAQDWEGAAPQALQQRCADYVAIPWKAIHEIRATPWRYGWRLTVRTDQGDFSSMAALGCTDRLLGMCRDFLPERAVPVSRAPEPASLYAAATLEACVFMAFLSLFTNIYDNYTMNAVAHLDFQLAYLMGYFNVLTAALLCVLVFKLINGGRPGRDFPPPGDGSHHSDKALQASCLPNPKNQ